MTLHTAITYLHDHSLNSGLTRVSYDIDIIDFGQQYTCLPVPDTGKAVFASVSGVSYMSNQLCCSKFMIHNLIRPESCAFQPESVINVII